MNLKPQLQMLLEYGNSEVMSRDTLENVVIPALLPFAKRLRASHFYAYVESDRRPVSISYKNRHNPELSKELLLGFKSRSDAARHPDYDPSEMQIVQRGVIVFLLDLICFAELDAGVFFLQKGNLKTGTEVPAEQLRTALKAQAQYQAKNPDSSTHSNLA